MLKCKLLVAVRSSNLIISLVTKSKKILNNKYYRASINNDYIYQEKLTS